MFALLTKIIRLRFYKGGIPEQARWAHSGSQSELRILLILPAHGTNYVISSHIDFTRGQQRIYCIEARQKVTLLDNWTLPCVSNDKHLVWHQPQL